MTELHQRMLDANGPARLCPAHPRKLHQRHTAHGQTLSARPSAVHPARRAGLLAAHGQGGQAVLQQHEPSRLRCPAPVSNRTRTRARALSSPLCQSARQTTRAAGASGDIALVCGMPPSGQANAAANRLRHRPARLRGLCAQSCRYRQRSRPDVHSGAKRQRLQRPLHPARPDPAGLAACVQLRWVASN